MPSKQSNREKAAKKPGGLLSSPVFGKRIIPCDRLGSAEPGSSLFLGDKIVVFPENIPALSRFEIIKKLLRERPVFNIIITTANKYINIFYFVINDMYG